MRTRTLATTVVLLGSLSGLTACSAGADKSAAAPATAAEAAGSSAAGSADQADGPPVAAVALDGSHDLVRAAALAVQVEDVAAAATRAVSIATAAGGGLVGQDAGADRDELQLQVLPGQLDAVLGSLAGLGSQTTRTVSTQDVTEQVVDLNSRLATQRASVARVRALLERAGTIAEVVAVEGELAAREAELESLRARSRALADQVSLAIVALTLTQQEADGDLASAGTFGDGLDGGVAALTGTARVAAIVAGALLPFAPLLLLAVVGHGLLARRREAP